MQIDCSKQIIDLYLKSCFLQLSTLLLNAYVYHLRITHESHLVTHELARHFEPYISEYPHLYRCLATSGPPAAQSTLPHQGSEML